MFAVMKIFSAFSPSQWCRLFIAENIQNEKPQITILTVGSGDAVYRDLCHNNILFAEILSFLLLTTKKEPPSIFGKISSHLGAKVWSPVKS